MENDQTERKVAAGRCYAYNKVHISRFIQNMYSPSFPCLTGVGPERGAGTTFKRARFFPTERRSPYLGCRDCWQRSLGQRSDPFATIMRPTPAELEVARALIARVKAADPSIKRVDEQLVCAVVA